VDPREDQDREPEQDRDEKQQPADYEAQHRVRRLPFPTFLASEVDG
jgi:hypothetical protein